MDGYTIIFLIVAFLAGYWTVSFVFNKVADGKADRKRPVVDFGQSVDASPPSVQGAYGGPDEEARHAEALDLGVSRDPECIKSKYRDISARYSPDGVSHLGGEFKALAEERTKRVEAAYSYFKNKYRF